MKVSGRITKPLLCRLSYASIPEPEEVHFYRLCAVRSSVPGRFFCEVLRHTLKVRSKLVGGLGKDFLSNLMLFLDRRTSFFMNTPEQIEAARDIFPDRIVKVTGPW